MKKKPLKVTWRNWCLYKLAKRDYSSYELIQAMLQRAKDSDQSVDPSPVVSKLIEEGLVDDERYITSQIHLQTESFNLKGPRVIKEKLQKKGGIPQDLIEKHIDENDAFWFDLAKKCRDKALVEKEICPQTTSKIPIAFFNKLKQQLYRKGFTKSQIESAMDGLSPEFAQEGDFSRSDADKVIQKQILSGKGPFAIKQVLKQKGATEETVSATLDFEDEQWISVAKSALEKKYRGTEARSYAQKRKQVDYLLRRGFSTDQAKAAIEERS